MGLAGSELELKVNLNLLRVRVLKTVYTLVLRCATRFPDRCRSKLRHAVVTVDGFSAACRWFVVIPYRMVGWVLRCGVVGCGVLWCVVL